MDSTTHHLPIEEQAARLFRHALQDRSAQTRELKEAVQQSNALLEIVMRQLEDSARQNDGDLIPGLGALVDQSQTRLDLATEAIRKAVTL